MARKTAHVTQACARKYRALPSLMVGAVDSKTMTQSGKPFTCELCGLMMADFIDGDGTVMHQRLRDQIQSDPKCQACFESYRRTAQLCRHAFTKPAIAPAFEDRLTAFLRRTCK
jgi:hypothetical protein